MQLSNLLHLLELGESSGKKMHPGFEFDLMRKNKIINACWLKNILFSKVISHLKPADKQ